MDPTREGGLLAWQYRGYPKGHGDRRNLLVHALTVPISWAGGVALIAAPVAGAWLLAVALPAMILPLALQGRTHRLEKVPPAPFRGPWDVAARLLVEQWITFPRFVLAGGFARQWRAGGEARADAGAAARR